MSLEEIEKIDESGAITKPFDPKDIDITTKQLSLDNLIKRLKFEEIDFFADFQRLPNLWDNGKQSRLIESILLRLPLPAFYFDGSDDQKWKVIDGLQRLSTIDNFVVKQTLRLSELEYLTQFNNYTFNELPRELQRRIEEANVTVYIVNIGTPDDVKFNIFKRINTGGLILTPQEIRHALNQGIPAQYVKALAEQVSFKKMISKAISNKRMEDRDFVTRFVAFYLTDYRQYEPDLDTFMNKAMKKIGKIGEDERQKMKSDFIMSMESANQLFGRYAFRKWYNLYDKRNPINKALFDTMSVNLAKLNKSSTELLITHKKNFQERFITLMNTDIFNKSITSATGQKNAVIRRFNFIEQLINSVIYDKPFDAEKLQVS